MPIFEDWLNEPLVIINNLFQSNPSKFDEKVQEYFDSKLNSEKNYQLIPLLNDTPIHDLLPNSLVRYRCMVQDSSNPEYYAPCQKLKHDVTQEVISLTSKYRDCINYPDGYDPIDTEHDHIIQLSQRISLYCVPIPGEADWVKHGYKSQSQILNNTNKITQESSFKRPIDAVVEQMSEIELKPEDDKSTKDTPNKRTRVQPPERQQFNNSTSSTASSIQLNTPLNEHGVTCSVRVYDNFEKFKLNDLVEFVGILSIDPQLAFSNDFDKQRSSMLNEESNQMEANNLNNQFQETNLPSSLVPRLHCIKAFQLKHNNSLVRPNDFIDMTNNGDFIKLRQDIFEFLKEYLLLGDSLAAEYLLMNMISGVFTRKDVTILGKFTLNLTNANDRFAQLFYNNFKKLVTMSHKFNLSIDSLNKTNMIPNKDYNTDKLITGMLQLPVKFNLIIDETCLDAGELKQKGLLNVQALSDIIKWQKLNYDFGFHPQEFNTNIRVLILSNGKSILPNDCQLKMLIPSDVNYNDYDANLEKFFAHHSLFIDNLRKYLTLVADLEYKINEQMQKLVEEDFVRLRQEALNSQDKMNVDDFHLLLVIARLQSISYGKTELNLSEWNRSKYLEKERRQRN